MDAVAALAQLVHAAGYHFITPTPATHARVIARPGALWATSLRDVFGWSRPFRYGAVPPEIMAAMSEAGVLKVVPGGFRSTIRLSSLDGLLIAHSAYPTSAADSVFFGPDTYRFAQAIAAVSDRPVRRAVDIGCGAGPGAILIARAHPQAEVYGVDINDAALALTRSNAALAGVTLTATRSDLLDAVAGTFDLIVSNPPYLIDPAERAYRHGGGPLGAGLSLKILGAALQRLSPGGTLVLYTGSAVIDGVDHFHEAALRHLDPLRETWRYIEMDPDVFGEELESGVYAAADRIAAVVLTVRRNPSSP